MSALPPAAPDPGECLRCGLCDVHCPALGARPGFPGPRAVGPDAERLRGTGPPAPEPALSGCLGCGTCERVCPRGLGPWRLARRAKEAIAAERGLSAAEAILSRGPALGPLGSLLAPLSNACLRSPPARLAESALGLDPGFPFPAWSRRPLRRLAAGLAAPAGEAAAGGAGPGGAGRAEAVLFAGCFAEYHRPAPALAALRLLAAAGVRTALAPPACCALPPLAKGDRRRAARLVRGALARLGPVLRETSGPLLFLSPSCLWMAREFWPELARGKAAEAAAGRAAEACGFVLGRFRDVAAAGGGPAGSPAADGPAAGRPPLRPARRLLAYQAPCHLRLAQSSLPAFGLAALAPGIELVDLDRGCCGLGGTYGMEAANAPVAEAAGRRLGEALAERPYEGVVSECEACRMQLARISGLRTYHPLEILAEALGYD